MKYYFTSTKIGVTLIIKESRKAFEGCVEIGSLCKLLLGIKYTPNHCENYSSSLKYFMQYRLTIQHCNSIM
jgi:hypothetical protein